MHDNFADLNNLTDGYRLFCLTENKSPKTLEYYTTFLEKFRHFLKMRHYPTDLLKIEKKQILESIRYLQTEAKNPRNGRPLSGATVQGYVRTLKAFLAWAVREEIIPPGRFGRLPMPKAPYRVIDTFSPEQIRKLLDTCRNDADRGHRNLVILMLLLDTGLRVSELVNLELDDVNLAMGNLKIRKGKGNRERIVPIGNLVQRALWKYIKSGRPQPLTPQISCLFLSQRGTPLTVWGVQQLLRRSGKKAGVKSIRCSPHTFRHVFSQNYLTNGGDVFSLQQILGHKSLAATKIYLNLYAIDIKKQHQRFSPMDNLAPKLTGRLL